MPPNGTLIQMGGGAFNYNRAHKVQLVGGTARLLGSWFLVVLLLMFPSTGDGHAQAPVTMGLNPNPVGVSVQAIFDVDVLIDAGSRQVTAAAAHVNFDPAKLQVVDAQGAAATEVAAGTALADVLANRVDNATGRVDFVAGIPITEPSANAPGGMIKLATITFRAIATTGPEGTPLAFQRTGARESSAFFDLAPAFDAAIDGLVVVREATP